MCPHGSKPMAKCSACKLDWQTNLRKTNPAKYLHRAAQARARALGIYFDIVVEDIIVPATCPVLGIPLNRRNRDYAATLDRVDGKKGYVRGNIRVISGRANRIKSDATVEELEAILSYFKAALSSR